MSDRPSLFAPEHAAAFEDVDVVREYAFRAPYPPATFDVLISLIHPEVRDVLDIGSGTGPIARALAPHVRRVDAIDPSAAMLAEGRRLAGDIANVRWLLGRAEDAPLDPPYSLATAGASVHWMDWDVVLPRLAQALKDGAFFAILDVHDRHAAWHPALVELFNEYSVYGRTWRDVDVIAELERRGLYQVVGRERTAMEFAQPLDEYIRALHSHSSLARARIGHDRAAEFDREVAKIATVSADDLVHRRIEAEVVWGHPLARASRPLAGHARCR